MNDKNHIGLPTSIKENGDQLFFTTPTSNNHGGTPEPTTQYYAYNHSIGPNTQSLPNSQNLPSTHPNFLAVNSNSIMNGIISISPPNSRNCNSDKLSDNLGQMMDVQTTDHKVIPPPRTIATNSSLPPTIPPTFPSTTAQTGTTPPPTYQIPVPTHSGLDQRTISTPNTQRNPENTTQATPARNPPNKLKKSLSTPEMAGNLSKRAKIELTFHNFPKSSPKCAKKSPSNSKNRDNQGSKSLDETSSINATKESRVQRISSHSLVTIPDTYLKRDASIRVSEQPPVKKSVSPDTHSEVDSLCDPISSPRNQQYFRSSSPMNVDVNTQMQGRIVLSTAPLGNHHSSTSTSSVHYYPFTNPLTNEVADTNHLTNDVSDTYEHHAAITRTYVDFSTTNNVDETFYQPLAHLDQVFSKSQNSTNTQ
eukprot:TRINITY_DN3650_c0_g1_i1.p1 TRINITY_DN3650_c0_g1~~TRINITY_DN3650_c0_g1_i1.p1  ORF type:complete len:421 (+),score=62.75 TRINITY_DN3650_c0_g1_i1:108-1370(+)